MKNGPIIHANEVPVWTEGRLDTEEELKIIEEDGEGVEEVDSVDEREDSIWLGFGPDPPIGFAKATSVAFANRCKMLVDPIGHPFPWPGLFILRMVKAAVLRRRYVAFNSASPPSSTFGGKGARKGVSVSLTILPSLTLRVRA
jgi:hypothetical protein